MCDGQIYNCFCSDGHLELHTLSLLPSQRQVVFKGDRLPFHCTAALVDKMTTIHWRHNGQLVTTDPEMGVQLESSVLHDCTFITRYLNLKCSLSVYFNFSAKAFFNSFIINFNGNLQAGYTDIAVYCGCCNELSLLFHPVN